MKNVFLNCRAASEAPTLALYLALAATLTDFDEFDEEDILFARRTVPELLVDQPLDDQVSMGAVNNIAERAKDFLQLMGSDVPMYNVFEAIGLLNHIAIAMEDDTDPNKETTKYRYFSQEIKAQFTGVSIGDIVSCEGSDYVTMYVAPERIDLAHADRFIFD